jgi:hypothetical protein
MIPNGPGACILRDVSEADYDRPTVCPDLAQLADHLIGTVTSLGAAAGGGAGATPGPGSPGAAHQIISPGIRAAVFIH